MTNGQLFKKKHSSVIQLLKSQQHFKKVSQKCTKTLRKSAIKTRNKAQCHIICNIVRCPICDICEQSAEAHYFDCLQILLRVFQILR